MWPCRRAVLHDGLHVDRRGRVYVEEINANGKIMGTHGRAGGYRDLFHDDGYVRAFLRIVGVDAHPEKKRYGGALAAALLGGLLKKDVDNAHEGSELLGLSEIDPWADAAN